MSGGTVDKLLEGPFTEGGEFGYPPPIIFPPRPSAGRFISSAPDQATATLVEGQGVRLAGAFTPAGMKNSAEACCREGDRDDQA